MTDRARGSKRRSLSLSKRQKKGHVKDEPSARASTTPITSFFTRSPAQVSCPLCGQLVPKFKINDHIDLQCKNFDRDGAGGPSDSNNAVPSKEMSHKSNLVKSPEQRSPAANNEETKISPYFKKHNSPQTTREVISNTVVRTIDLGSISSKLSGIYQGPEGRPTQDKHVLSSRGKEMKSEVLSSSQKENLCQNLDDNDDCPVVMDLTKDGSDEDTYFSIASPLCSEEANSEHTASKSVAVHAMSSRNLACPSSKLIKRKANTETSSGGIFGSGKKARHDERSGQEQTEVISSDVPLDNAGDKPHDIREPFTASYSTQWNISSKDVHEKCAKESDNGKLTVSSAGNTNKKSESAHPSRLPYYLRNFRTVLEAVLENGDDRVLFNAEDLSFIHSFEELSVMGQKLYVRLFQRKMKWLQVNKLDYEEICSDLGPVARELVDCGFLEAERDLQDLGEVLALLPAPELKALAKTFHLGCSGTQKQQLVDGLLRLSRQKSLFTPNAGQNNVGSVILKRARQIAGSCVRLHRGPRAVFSRVLLLFSVTETMEEEETAAGGQGQLYMILLFNSGRLAFPDYTVQRSAKLFQDREELIRYEAAMRALQEVMAAMQAGQWEEALELHSAAKMSWQELRKICDLSHQEELPVFLRCFSTGWAYTRILSRGVEILQRLRRYEEAVAQLRALLAQCVYCPDSRGRWWDRLALNLHQHLKQPEQAICAIRDGLSDPLVRTGHQLALHQRAARMKESASFKKYIPKLRELPTLHVQDVTHVTIRGQLFPHEGGTGKSVFLMPANEEGQGSSNSTIMCSVEELSLAHYRRQGFDQGIHGEGSTFSTLFGLLFWDVIFMEGIPDVFRNAFQACPLDLVTDCFYGNRSEAIETRVELLCQAPVETLHGMLEDVWSSHEGEACLLVNWDRFASLQQAKSLVSCLGGVFLGGIGRRMAKDYRHCRGGLPDLVVWSSTNNTYKLVEVKGPNDRLSQKQQIWLDELQKLGADVEVCHVTATGARGISVE